MGNELGSGAQIFYVRGADGRMFEEIPQPGGGFEYVEAPKGLSFTELPNGRFMAIRDMAEAQHQRELDSHMRYFESLTHDSQRNPQGARHAMKRQEALQRQLEQLVIDRVSPPAGANIVKIKDEEFFARNEEYQAAAREGRGKECDFQPISTYQHKLVTKSGKQIRPIFKGEVGMLKDKILVLEEGYGSGLLVGVAADISKKEE